MTTLRADSYEVDGLVLDDEVHHSSGTASPTHSGLAGDRYWKTDGTVWRLEAGGTGWIKDVIKGSNEIIFSFSGTSNPFVSTSNSSYQLISEFIFPGSDLSGSPSSIFLLCGSNHATNKAAFKLYDRTNALTIAENLSVIGEDRVEVSLGTVSNTPTASSVFEIQAKRIDSSVTAELGAIRMEFL